MALLAAPASIVNTAGTYQVIAVYAGNTTYLTSTSTVFPQTVTQTPAKQPYNLNGTCFIYTAGASQYTLDGKTYTFTPGNYSAIQWPSSMAVVPF